MKPSESPRFVVLLLSGLLAAGLVGCGSQPEEAEAVAAPTEVAEETEVAATEAGDEESTTDTVVIDMSQPASPADYNAALQEKNYMQAADVVLRMNAQNVQGADTLNRMRELQDEVARAAANGDPRARQAAEMLRRIGRMPSTGAPQ